MKRHLILLTILSVSAVLSVLAVAPPAAATTVRYVSPPPLVGVPPGFSCTFAGYSTIQAAVTASSAGDTIVVCSGVYPEQVTVDKDLTLTGSSNSSIQAPAVLVPDGDGKKNIVEINNGASVTISGFIVTGPGPSGCGSIDTGIAVLDGATLDVSSTTVRDIRDSPFSGCQNGEGIRVGTPRYSTTPQVGQAVIDQVIVTGYQKNGIVVAGAGSTGKITNSTTTGNGPTTIIAQNGVEVVDGASATVTTNVIRDDYYTPKGVTACGLLIIDAAGVQESQNTYQGDERNKCTVSGRGGTFQG